MREGEKGSKEKEREREREEGVSHTFHALRDAATEEPLERRNTRLE